MGPTPPAKGTPCSSVFPAPVPASIPAPGPDLVPRVEQVNKIVGTKTLSSASGGVGGISRDTSGSSTSSSTSSTKNKRKSDASTVTKRRRRVSDSGHCPPIPAPADCPWTSNKEQFEEARAKEARYSITNAPAAPAIAVQAKSLRPWEWSTRDCAAVAEDAISSFSGFLGARPAGAGTRVLLLSSLVGAGGRPIFSDGDGDDGDSGGDEDCGRGGGGGDGDGDDGVHICDDDEDVPDEEGEEPVANRQIDAAMSMKPRGEKDNRGKTVLSQNSNRGVTAGRGHQDQGREPAKWSVKSSKRGTSAEGRIEDPVVEDSRRAKELSAALNRNPPRGVASQTAHQGVIRSSAIDKDKFAGADKTNKKKRPRPAPTISAAAAKGRKTATTGGGGAQGHPWTDSGLFFGKGTTAEVGKICILRNLIESLNYRERRISFQDPCPVHLHRRKCESNNKPIVLTCPVRILCPPGI